MPEQELNVQSVIDPDFFSEECKDRLVELEDRNKSLCTQLQERLISLTASIKTLKEKLDEEKQLWKLELHETIDLERKQSEYKWYNNCMSSGEYNQQLEMLTNAVLKCQAIQSAQIQKEIETSIYRQKLMEAESLCNLEMLKIRNSLECLLPLRAIIDGWNSDSRESINDDLKIENNDMPENFCEEPNNEIT